MKRSALGLALCVLAAAWGNVDAADSSEGAAEKAPAPKTHAVTREPFVVTVSVKGVFESSTTAEVFFESTAWSGNLTVREAVEHGAFVRAGEVIVQLETRELEESIATHELDFAIAELGVAAQQQELEDLEDDLRRKLETAERLKRYSEENLARFHDINRPLSEKRAKFSVQEGENYLEYQREELRQLEKMYKDDDLTEETEEIVLKRQRDAVRRAEFALGTAETSARRTLDVELPRRDEKLQTATRTQTKAFEKANRSLPRDLEKKRLEVSKSRLSLQASSRRLDLLREALSRTSLKAPRDGVVYYGRAERGKWTGSPGLAEKLRPRGSVRPNEVLMTIVDPRDLSVRSAIPEANLADTRSSLKATVTPTGYADLELAARLGRVSLVPSSGGVFDAQVTLHSEESRDQLYPGMTCTVLITTYTRSAALTVPDAAVTGSESDGHSVQVVTGGRVVGDDGIERRSVKVGKRHDGKVEILAGLNEGEKVLLGSQ